MPGVAFEATVRVRSEVPVPGAAIDPELLKPAVTFAGRPVADKPIAESKPFTAVVEIVDVPLLPWITVTELGEAEMVKLGVGGPVRAVIRAVPFMLPQPVTRS